MKSRSYLAASFAAAALVVLSCDVSTFVPAQALPTAVPGGIDLFVAQTAAVAQSATALENLPTWTFTPSATPTQTASPTPTITPTFVFQMEPFTLTAISVAHSSGSSGSNNFSSPTPAKDYACQVVYQSPANGAKFGANNPFKLIWKVKNVGNLDWILTSVDLVYMSGTQFTPATLFDLPATVTSGSAIVLAIQMQAPASTGTYTTKWMLRRGAIKFCPLTLGIRVP